MVQNKKNLAYQIILLILSVALIFTTLFVPLLHLIACDSSKVVVYDKIVSLFQYTKDAPFANEASNMYWSSNGPIWLAVAGILLNYFAVAMLIVLAGLCIFAIITSKSEKFQKVNRSLKKMAILASSFMIFVFVFEFVSFILTTKLANGYASFEPYIQPHITLTLGIQLMVFGGLIEKEKYNDEQNKTKDIVGFSLSALFSILGIAFLFVPQFSEIMAAETSLFSLTRNATTYGVENMFGDVPIGLIFYVGFSLIFASLFVVIYSIFGIVRAAKGKSTNWLSSRLKRWSMAIFITNLVLDFLIYSSIAVLISSTEVIGQSVILPTFFIAIFVPFALIISSEIISYKKKKNDKQQVKQTAEQK